MRHHPRSALGAVAAGHRATAEAGAWALRKGGNAADAVLCGALAATVCEPLLTGLAGGGLFTLAEPGRPPSVLEGFSAFPGLEGGLLPGEFHPVRIDYGPLDQAFHVGLGAVAVPGAAEVLDALFRRHGRLPRAQLVEPALRLADEGWVATRTSAVVYAALEQIVRTDAHAASVLLPVGLPSRGDLVSGRWARRSLELFAEGGAEPFRSGPAARALVEACAPPRASLSPADLGAFEALPRDPIRLSYRGATIHLPPPPCVGGALIAFGIELFHRLAARVDAGGFLPVALLVQAATEEARRLGFDHDPFRQGAVSDLLDAARLDAVAAELSARLDSAGLAAPPPPAPAPPPGNPLGNTTHISAVDAEGFAVAWTSSNGETAGALWPGLDIPLNNFLGEADLHPLGFHRGTPGTRLRTMMSPTVVTWPDGAVCALGTGGANRIRTTMLSVLHHLCSGEALARAVDAPRVHVERGTASIEDAPNNARSVSAARALGFEVAPFDGPHLYFGGVHAVARDAEGRFSAVGDARRDGHALVVEPT